MMNMVRWRQSRFPPRILPVSPNLLSQLTKFPKTIPKRYSDPNKNDTKDCFSLSLFCITFCFLPEKSRQLAKRGPKTLHLPSPIPKSSQTPPAQDQGAQSAQQSITTTISGPKAPLTISLSPATGPLKAGPSTQLLAGIGSSPKSRSDHPTIHQPPTQAPITDRCLHPP